MSQVENIQDFMQRFNNLKDYGVGSMIHPEDWEAIVPPQGPQVLVLTKDREVFLGTLPGEGIGFDELQSKPGVVLHAVREIYIAGGMEVSVNDISANGLPVGARLSAMVAVMYFPPQDGARVYTTSAEAVWEEGPAELEAAAPDRIQEAWETVRTPSVQNPAPVPQPDTDPDSYQMQVSITPKEGYKVPEQIWRSGDPDATIIANLQED